MVADANNVTRNVPLPHAGPHPLRTIVTAGLIGGAFDITYAFIAYGALGMSPIRIGQSVAAGLLGREAALAGGVPTGLLGLALHFFIAIIMAAVYYGAATRIPLLVKRAVPCGLAYGLALYIVMNYVVMPLSAIKSTGGGGPLYIPITGVLVHVFLVGLSIALLTRRGLRAA
ncbi:MAG: hypothetical protein ABI885_20685 [Gammaproteobacteria bacterium]